MIGSNGFCCGDQPAACACMWAKRVSIPSQTGSTDFVGVAAEGVGSGSVPAALVPPGWLQPVSPKQTAARATAARIPHDWVDTSGPSRCMWLVVEQLTEASRPGLVSAALQFWTVSAPEK